MAHLKIQPPGQFPLNKQDRKPIIKVIGGDSWHVSLNLYNPARPCEPACPENTIVDVKLAETQFDDYLWSGEWYSGVIPDKSRKGLCHIKVPKEITTRLRRGSYMFSVRVSDNLNTTTETEAEGSFLLEYGVTSEQHSIPYKDGTGGMSKPVTIADTDKQSYLEKAINIIKQEIRDIRSRQNTMLEDIGDLNTGVGTAVDTAAEANLTAGTANMTAEEAKHIAETANSTAEEAKQIAETANSTADYAINNMAIPYQFNIVHIANGEVTLAPFTNSKLDLSTEASDITVKVNIGTAEEKMRDLWFEVIAGTSATTVTWPDKTVAANEDESNLLVEPSTTNVFLISEYSENKFIVARQVISES